jgi:hypothetical protein
MAVVEALTEEESYLIAILMDPSGVDIAEFLWQDPNEQDNLFRCYPFQYPWYRNDAKKQIDQCARAIGKSVGIQMRGFAFPFTNPGQEMLITAPELIHLDPVTKNIEDRLMSTRLSREMLKSGNQSSGITHRPFEAKFRNGSKIIGRIPQKDGKGVKGCVAAGTLVLTRAGMVPIENVKIGDEVFTHMGRWKKVTANFRFENPDGYVIAGGGHRGLVTSDNHRMYGRRNANPQRARKLERADWVAVDDEELPDRYYLGSPTRFPAEPMPQRFDSAPLMWAVGRYVADGHLTYAKKNDKLTSGRMHIIVDDHHVDAVLDRLDEAGLNPSAKRREHNGTYDVECSDTELCRLIEEHFGRHADGKTIPVWLLGADDKLREAFLQGYLSRDGHWDAAKKRWQAGTASKVLAVNLRLLGQTLGYTAALSWVDVKPNKMSAAPLRSWRVTLSESNRNVVVDDEIAWQKIRSVTPIKDIPVVHDLTVEDDHSYLADGLISHNMHPRWLEMDEAQDYPEPGWIELVETLRYGDPTARWRAHGVSRGVRDYYYKISNQPDWFVHKVTAMHRPDWTDEERRSKADLYGSRESADYRRNILGLHGDAMSSLFVLHRLMACVDSNESSDYNSNVYTHIRISDEYLKDVGLPIEQLIEKDLPLTHKSFKRVWIGMDVGMTNHPTEILVYGAEPKPNDRRGATDGERIRVLTRVHLERISGQDQLRVMNFLAEFYRPLAFGMDRTGLGLPIFQVAQDPSMSNTFLAKAVRGYNFSEKIVVGFEAPEDSDDPWKPYVSPEDRAIMGNVLEYSSDTLRLLVDQARMVLPWDTDMLKEFQGQMFYIKTSATNPYGKKEFNKGKFHALDAARMAALAWSQESIEKQLSIQPEATETLLTWADSPVGYSLDSGGGYDPMYSW